MLRLSDASSISSAFFASLFFWFFEFISSPFGYGGAMKDFRLELDLYAWARHLWYGIEDRFAPKHGRAACVTTERLRCSWFVA